MQMPFIQFKICDIYRNILMHFLYLKKFRKSQMMRNHTYFSTEANKILYFPYFYICTTFILKCQVPSTQFEYSATQNLLVSPTFCYCFQYCELLKNKNNVHIMLTQLIYQRYIVFIYEKEKMKHILAFYHMPKELLLEIYTEEQNSLMIS